MDEKQGRLRMRQTTKKTKIAREKRARYVTSDVREINIANRRFLLRHPNPEAIKSLKRDVLLYEKHAKQLEMEHKGEYVAIGLDGSLVVGPKHVQVLIEAAEKFGPSNFALWKIGYDYELAWRQL